MTYNEARVYLDELSKYGSVLGLDTIHDLLCELDNPQDSLNFIHIAGTNGKGSVLACTSTILSEAGYKTGRYVSPTVISYLEKIQVNGKWISEDQFARLTEVVRDAIARMEKKGKTSPTLFEVETAIAFLYFKETACDFVVLECGLGGAEDATNIISHSVCSVFTSIGIDHLGVIGNSLEEIGQTKSGIIKNGSHVISAPQPDSVKQILLKQAELFQNPIQFSSPEDYSVLEESWQGQTICYKDFNHIKVPLPGRYQAPNIMTVLEILLDLRTQGYPISTQHIQDGFQKTVWPGRFTCIGETPLFFVDGAHNTIAAKKLRESIETYFPGKQISCIVGIFKDKEYDSILSIMGPLMKKVHAIELPNKDRSLSLSALTDALKTHCTKDTLIFPESTIEDAVDHLLLDADQDDILLAFGSLSYLGQVMEYKKLTDKK